jgi:hypothetical protein
MANSTYFLAVQATTQQTPFQFCGRKKQNKNTRINNNPTWATGSLPFVRGVGLCMALLTFIILVSTGIANVFQL